MATVGEAFCEVLLKHRVGAVFGNPGSNELPFLRYLPDDLPYYLALQEGAAIAMADGYAQASGTVGFVNLHAASGTGNAMGCLTNTASSHTPLLITAGQQSRRYHPVNALLTNVDATKLCEPLVKWSGEPLRPEDAPLLASKALLLAQSAPAGPVYLSVPLDDWDRPADAATQRQLLDRSVHGRPVAPDSALEPLVQALAEASDPVLVLGPGVDTPLGYPAAIAFAQRSRLPVWNAPSAPRAPFPTTHPYYRGQLPSAAGDLARALDGHDLILVFGAPLFRYHAPSQDDYLPAGVAVHGVTDDPDEAARAPFGHVVIGDPAAALAQLVATVPVSTRTRPEAQALPVADTSGPAFTAEAITDAIDRGKTDDAVISFEWTSGTGGIDRLMTTHPQSRFFPAAGGLGWGMPAAIGLRLARPDRPVLALIGDGAMQYTTSALWTAARYRVPVTFIVANNRRYGALSGFSRLLGVPDGSYLDVPDVDIVKIAEGYGVAAQRVESLDELTQLVKVGMSATEPRLIEVPQREA
ncbi:benzoylformate decarboxylase [Streptomyces sp. NPDC059477]|uniref:benzoylformate decarboxylase n=1 Tax=Streptomyces sp. NPDC059477 TaxID=3346847 RepID=UPI0036B14354